MAAHDSTDRDAGAALVALVVERYTRLLEHADDPDRALLRRLHHEIVSLFCRQRHPALPRGVLGAPPALGREMSALLASVCDRLREPKTDALLAAAPAVALGHAYEQCLALGRRGAARKAAGVYYTPAPIAEALVEQTVGRLCDELGDAPGDDLARMRIPVRVIDPACGAGVFLVHAYRRLWRAYRDHWRRQPASERRGRVVGAGERCRLTLAESRRILDQCIHGVDLDAYALDLARLTLTLEMLDLAGARDARAPGARDDRVSLTGLRTHLRCGDALLMPDLDRGGFDVVLGNPPWGQKAIVASDDIKARLRRAYPSSAGIFDWFRPFVELGIGLTREGGHFGMVLPDIILLKNYEPTRRHILDHLAIDTIEWLGMAFAGATIDAVTLAGRRAAAEPEHRVNVAVRDPLAPLRHVIEQRRFRQNPRCTFNLHLTEDRRRVIDGLRDHPRLGDIFEVHEGVHSGNIRAELFVTEAVDPSCQKLYFGRDELRPYSLKWAGYHVRLSALPKRRTPERYANLGQPRWHRAAKVLVRRTGDRVMAAVDPHGCFASNNFFLVIPRCEHALDLDGLAALLNSAFMTWYFQTIEPRKGRAFAEIKIKHLVDFPLPPAGREAACQRLNQLGAEQRRVSAHAMPERRGPAGARLDADIERALHDALEPAHSWDGLVAPYSASLRIRSSQ